ncbi:PREDICTED: matrix extracellular phosphoglycoprotein, partial [Eurypyga helias]|uniref:matrix extracellular phosphoglycoprotein n=1 Tax=Eurypyga helias TaxID=54383 RepID=UPI00052807B4
MSVTDLPKMQTALVCLCLLSMAVSTPVPLPMPGRAAGNCVGQHRILLKGCNAKHGFYVFKYVYSFSTRRNQTQIKKEEADSQSTVLRGRLGEDNASRGPAEDVAAPEHDGNGSTDVIENVTGLKSENRSTPGAGGDARSPHPGTGMRARGGVSVTGPTPASSEGSGDLHLVVEVDGGVSILPQGGRPSEAVAGNRSGVRNDDRDDGDAGEVPVEGAMTAGRERAPATTGTEDEGSGEAAIPGQGQEDVVRGTGTESTALASVTEKMEDVQVDAKGVDEYAYIPDSGSITITRGKAGGAVTDTSITQISPDKDDEVNIFIGRANIHVGEQETTQAGATLGSEDDGAGTHGNSDDEVRGVGQRFEGRPGHPAFTTPHQESDDEMTAAVPAKGASIRLATTVASPSMSEGDCTTTLGTAGSLKAALGHSRQVDQVKRADELHVRERAFYALGRAGGGPRGPYTNLRSADSSQSSEGERGSHSDSQQTGLQPS